MSTIDVSTNTNLLSQKAEIFRSKLIADFHLLESFNEGGGRLEVPRYSTNDILGECYKC